MANNAFTQAKQSFKSILADMWQSANPIRNFQRGVGKLRDFRIDYPANRAYVGGRIRQKISPNIPIDRRTMEEPKILSPDISRGQVKSESARLEPFSISSNKSLEGLKQVVISHGGYRPAMQRYLSTVPVYNFPGGPGEPAGIASTYKGQPSIGMSPDSPQGRFIQPRHREVMEHELAHTAPRPKEYEKSFKAFFKSVNHKSQPLLYKIGLEYKRNGQPPPNEEEFYATLAQRLGPDVLNIPEIRKYYINLFQRRLYKTP